MNFCIAKNITYVTFLILMYKLCFRINFSSALLNADLVNQHVMSGVGSSKIFFFLGEHFPSLILRLVVKCYVF